MSERKCSLTQDYAYSSYSLQTLSFDQSCNNYLIYGSIYIIRVVYNLLCYFIKFVLTKTNVFKLIMFKTFILDFVLTHSEHNGMNKVHSY